MLFVILYSNFKTKNHEKTAATFITHYFNTYLIYKLSSNRRYFQSRNWCWNFYCRSSNCCDYIYNE